MQTFAERKRALEKNLGPGKETGGTPNRNHSNIFVFIFFDVSPRIEIVSTSRLVNLGLKRRGQPSVRVLTISNSDYQLIITVSYFCFALHDLFICLAIWLGQRSSPEMVHCRVMNCIFGLAGQRHSVSIEDDDPYFALADFLVCNDRGSFKSMLEILMTLSSGRWPIFTWSLTPRFFSWTKFM